MPSSLPSRVLRTAQQNKPKTRTSPEKQHCLCFSPFSTLRTIHTCFTAARHQDVDSVLHRSARLTRGSGDAENDTVLPISSDHLPHDAAFSPIDEHRIPSLRFDAVPNFKAQIEQHTLLGGFSRPASALISRGWRTIQRIHHTPVARRTTTRRLSSLPPPRRCFNWRPTQVSGLCVWLLQPHHHQDIAVSTILGVLRVHAKKKSKNKMNRCRSRTRTGCGLALGSAQMVSNRCAASKSLTHLATRL